MLTKLRNRLILVYTISTGIIFILAMFFVYQVNISKNEKSCMEQLVHVVDMISNQLQNDNVINNTQLSLIESQNDCIIYIEDNGIPLQYTGVYHTNTNRNDLVELLRNAVESDGIYTRLRPITNKLLRSSIKDIKGKDSDSYYGMTLMLLTQTTYYAIFVLYNKQMLYNMKLNDSLFFLCIILFSILFLFLISYKFVDRTLRPITENNKKQTEFVACASHELRSPLAYIKVANDILLKDFLPSVSSKQQESCEMYLKNTRDECDRMSILIEDMLLLASTDQVTWTIQKANVDIDSFLIETYEKLLPICETSEHDLCIDLPDQLLGHIIIDEYRIYQIIQILINNAISYSPSHTTLTLKSRKEKRQLYIYVIDHGQGMNAEEKSRVFDRYYRVQKEHNDRNHFGLGLSIAKTLAQLHNGSITIQDTPGGGSTFVVSLPIV